MMAKRKDPLKAALGNLGRAPDASFKAEEGRAEEGGVGVPPAPAPLRAPLAPPPSLVSRANALSEVADGARRDVIHRLVDPSLVRPWAHHNRAYDTLTPARVADLIEGLRAQGRQEFPAIVRRLPEPDEAGHEYEFVCGARRHFAVSYLRQNGHPDFRYLIEVRSLSDEEAFRLSDVENRDREDLSDYERALDYLGALGRYYGGQQKRMAARLEMSQSYLSNFLDLGRLPSEVIAAFADTQQLRVHHSRSLKPLLKGRARGEVLMRAGVIAKFQEERRTAGQPLLQATTVLAELKGDSAPAGRPRPARHEVAFEGGAGGVQATRKGLKVAASFDLAEVPDRTAFVAAMGRLWDELNP